MDTHFSTRTRQVMAELGAELPLLPPSALNSARTDFGGCHLDWEGSEVSPINMTCFSPVIVSIPLLPSVSLFLW